MSAFAHYQRRSLDDVREELSLNEALLEIYDDDNAQGLQTLDREEVERKIRELRREIHSRTHLPNWSAGVTPREMDFNSSLPLRPDSSGSSHYSTPSSNTDAGVMAAPSPYVALPERKRLREAGDEDFDRPFAKSVRPSPSPAMPASPASTSSFNFDDFDDDPMIMKLLGEDRSGPDHRTYLQRQADEEKRRKQEMADAELARMLDQDFNQRDVSLVNNYGFKPSNHVQSTFQPYGSTLRAMLPPPPPPKPAKVDTYVKQEPLTTPTFGHPYMSYKNGLQSPVSLSDDDSSDLEEITALEFTPRDRAVQNSRAIQNNGPMSSMPLAASTSYPVNSGYPTNAYLNNGYAPQMPGGFPTSPYAPLGDSAVYQQNFGGLYANTGNNHMGYSTPAPSYTMPGSYGSPLDVDDYDDAYSRRLQDVFADPGRTEEDIKELLKHIRPDEELSPEQREGTPEELKFPLMEHQKLGLAWMKKMEESSNRGGILADDMGLGKTIQALSLMVSRRPERHAPKPTLVVAPVALLQQWKREAAKMIKNSVGFRVFIAHGESRRTKWVALKEFDLILTTYGTLASELKRKLAWDEKKRLYVDARPTAKEELPLLGDTSKFHRVILDEAQNIKNRNTKAAVAACYIQSEHRWCMTGTPMQNNIDELYSLIKFCRIKPYNDWSQFSKDFSRPLKNKGTYGKDKAMQQLQALLRVILLRRTKSSEIDGRPILQLPPKTETQARAVFSKDERDFYKALETSSQLQFNKYLKAGSIGKNYSNVLVLLLRLRQACCHPHLIKDFAIHTGVDGLDLVENARELPKHVVERLKELEAFECPICMDAAENPVIFNPCGHALCEDCLSKLVDAASTNEEGQGPICPHCRAKINTQKYTDHQSFLRVWCPDREGIEPLNEDDESGSDVDSDSESEVADEDDDDGADLKDFIVNDDEEIEYDNGSDEEKKYAPGATPFEKSKKPADANTAEQDKTKKSRNGKGKGKRREKRDNSKSLAQLRKEGLRNKAAKKKYLRRLEKDWQTSAKIEKTLELLDTVHARGSGEKTIIFSGFTSFLDLLEVPLHRHPNFSIYARYDGSMTARDRNDAVLAFTDNPHCRIMLVSLKAGNSGLNLTAANNVIILDPHWNPFVEMQAADRAYRIGQMRPVEIHRVLIASSGLEPQPSQAPLDDDPDVEPLQATVEDRILALQEKKRLLVENALDENAGRTVGRLGVRELGYLFGLNGIPTQNGQ